MSTTVFQFYYKKLKQETLLHLLFNLVINAHGDLVDNVDECRPVVGSGLSRY